MTLPITITTMAKRRVLRRRDVTEEEWTAHKKLCKKRASAKWYLKKRAKELDEIAQQKEMERQQRREKESGTVPQWTQEERLEWRCNLLYRTGWPKRPGHVPPDAWVNLVNKADASWQVMRQHEFAQNRDPVRLERMAKHLLVQELLQTYQHHQPGSSPEVDVKEAAVVPLDRSPPADGWRFTPRHGLWVCSALGLVFMRLYMDNSLSLWPDVCRWWQQNNTAYEHIPNMNHNTLQSQQSHWEQTDVRNHMAPIQTPIIQDPAILQLISGK